GLSTWLHSLGGLKRLYQLLQNGSRHEEWIAFRVYAIIRDATTRDIPRVRGDRVTGSVEEHLRDLLELFANFAPYFNLVRERNHASPHLAAVLRLQRQLGIVHVVAHQLPPAIAFLGKSM
uniref:hypothetical protein n=1 Tax=Acidovorax sp. sic0104 TaxID=2854784 RepID=UPI001C45B866